MTARAGRPAAKSKANNPHQPALRRRIIHIHMTVRGRGKYLPFSSLADNRRRSVNRQPVLAGGGGSEATWSRAPQRGSEAGGVSRGRLRRATSRRRPLWVHERDKTGRRPLRPVHFGAAARPARSH